MQEFILGMFVGIFIAIVWIVIVMSMKDKN